MDAGWLLWGALSSMLSCPTCGDPARSLCPSESRSPRVLAIAQGYWLLLGLIGRRTLWLAGPMLGFISFSEDWRVHRRLCIDPRAGAQQGHAAAWSCSSSMHLSCISAQTKEKL